MERVVEDGDALGAQQGCVPLDIKHFRCADNDGNRCGAGLRWEPLEQVQATRAVPEQLVEDNEVRGGLHSVP